MQGPRAGHDLRALRRPPECQFAVPEPGRDPARPRSAPWTDSVARPASRTQAVCAAALTAYGPEVA